MTTYPALRYCGAILVMALVSLISGCVPTTWLPDSSGFVYVKRHKLAKEDDPPVIQLVHFDLKKKASRVVVDKVDSNTVWPALSPDGKRIAVARFAKGKKDGWTVQIVFHDFDGKMLHQSKPFEWKSQAKLDQPTLLFWSPKEDKVVVTTMQATGFYDIRTDSLECVEGLAAPLIHGGTPIRPDGKGCLMLVEDRTAFRLTFRQWDGSERIIDMDRIRTGNRQEGDLDFQTALCLSPLATPSWWDGNTAVLGSKYSQTAIRFDTVAKTVVGKVPVAGATAACEMFGASHDRMTFDLDAEHSISLIQFRDKSAGQTDEKPFTRVVVQNRKTGVEKTLFAKEAAAAWAAPSPNGEYLAVTFCDEGELLKLVVINSKGEVVTKIDATK